jgi:hypothetical protein
MGSCQRQGWRREDGRRMDRGGECQEKENSEEEEGEGGCATPLSCDGLCDSGVPLLIE